ncbi:MAG: hypothetical protein K0S04_4269, partial [Herbinix sp.]|nr:hypothetical protein [Herbinix sp.]
ALIVNRRKPPLQKYSKTHINNKKDFMRVGGRDASYTLSMKGLFQ